MAVRITHVRIEGFPEDHQHITSYKWINEADNGTGTSNKPTMVEWIDVKKGRAYVGTGSSKVEVVWSAPKTRLHTYVPMPIANGTTTCWPCPGSRYPASHTCEVAASLTQRPHLLAPWHLAGCTICASPRGRRASQSPD